MTTQGLEAAVPNVGDRKIVCRAIVEVLDELAASPDAWILTLSATKPVVLRLSVGPVEIMWLTRDGTLRFLVDRKLTRRELGPTATIAVSPHSAASGTYLVTVDSREFATVPSRARKAHRAAAVRLSRTRAGHASKTKWTSAKDTSAERYVRAVSLDAEAKDAFLLLWDQTEGNWPNAAEDFESIVLGDSPELVWRCGPRKTIPVGSRVFIKRTGPQPRGIVAMGHSIRDVESDADGNAVAIRLVSMVEPRGPEALDCERLKAGVFSGVHWTPQASGTRIDARAATALEQLWAEGSIARSAAASSLFDATAVRATATEIERLTRERVGQNLFRDRLMKLWHGKCALSGLAVPGLLRASHIKRWADCDPKSERLDPFNGFMFAAHVDALFEEALLIVEDDGSVVLAPSLSPEVREKLGLLGKLKIAGIQPRHRAYLAVHRARASWRKKRKQ